MSKKDLIKEELKRHMQLLEYTFYMEEPKEKEDNLLLSTIDTLNEQEPPEGEETDPFADEGGAEGGAETDPFADEGGAEGGTETDPFADEGGAEIEDEVADEGGEETIEVDVTDIVDKSEQTRSEIESMTSKMDELLGKLGDLEGKVGDMDKVIEKIDGLEKEIEERNPTPVERLEMRSMDSFPYSISLTDYWSDKEGYDVGSQKEEEYVITQGDVDSYSVDEIKDSFDYNKTDED